MVDPSPSRLGHASRRLLQDSLQLNHGQNLLIFADPAAQAVVELVTAEAQKLGVSVTTLYIPRTIQSNFPAHASLPLPVEAAIREANAVLSCLSPQAEHMAYRARVLRDSWRRRVRVAHAPGMDLEVLRMLDTDFDLVRERCRDLALALIMGKELCLHTRDSRGEAYALWVELQGWDLPPGISDGRIPDGSWANLPPGETFIVPYEAEGAVAINGSVPGRVIRPGQEIVLHFQEGRLKYVQPEDSPTARYLHATQIAYAEQANDPNWRNLAEVGFGVNPAIHHLTGVELVDEKRLGTVHVALGASNFLGGSVESTIHCDLVIEEPTVTIDKKSILEEGRWLLRREDWLPDHLTISVPAGWWASVRTLRRTSSRSHREHGLLYRGWGSRSGGRLHIPVGVERTSLLAARLMDILHERGVEMPKAAFIAQARQAGLLEKELPALVWILDRYDLVRVQKGP